MFALRNGITDKDVKQAYFDPDGDGRKVYAPLPPGTSSDKEKETDIKKKETDNKKIDGFKPSNQTAELHNNRSQIEAQKPGNFTYGEYQESDLVKQAQALLQQQLSQKPGEYQSAWQSQLDEVMNKIMNREKFSYDLNGDALYQQYKDMYTQQGKMAMMDTMGQAQAMTGGYGNSYAQSVGQQAYQSHLQQLNDRVPELYQLALDKYNMEGQEMLNQYAMLGDRENQDYSRYRDTVSDYYTELDRLTDDYRYASETDYGRYIDGYNMAYGEHRDSVSDWQQELARADDEYWNNRQYDYQAERDRVADEQWQKEFDLAKKQYDESVARQAASQAKDIADSAIKGVNPDNVNPKPVDNDDGDGDQKPTRDSVVADMNDLISSGASKSEINKYLIAALQEGYITQSDYNELKNQFAPKGYTYR